MKVNDLKVKDKDLESKYGQMGLITMVNGIITNYMATAYEFHSTAAIIQDIGSGTWQKDKVHLFIQTDQYIKENERKI